MGLFTKTKSVTDEAKLEWPNCVSPEIENQTLNINGTPYKKSEVEPEKWQWVKDERAIESLREYQQVKSELFHALTSRVLTNEELLKAASYGSTLNTPCNISYNPKDRGEELTRAFLIQSMLRQSLTPST